MQVKRESMVLGLQLLSVGVDGPILDSAAGEEILFVQRAIAVALGRHPPELPGTLYITTKRVMWLSDADKSKGYAVDLLSICLREVSVFCDQDLYLPSCICIQIKTEDDENANSKDSNSEGAGNLELSKIKMMWLWPSDLGRLDYLFDVFRRCLKPEPNEVKPTGYIFGDHHLSERMLKVEKLIKGLSGMPGDLSTADIVQVEKSSLMSDISLQHMKNETTVSDIHRIAREISMLKLSVNDAKVLHAENDLFIENLERQIQSATSLFKVCLEHCFVNSLKHQDASFIDKCLCAYGYIDNTLAAEEIFRKTIVAPLVQNILCGDTSLEELEEYYRQIKHCIENDWNFFLKLSLSGLHVSDFWANSILKEVILAIKNGKPKAFSPDELMVFLNNYNSSLRFLAFLEGCFPSLSDVDMLRSDIMRQLNVRDYFSHRLQEIARFLDSVLGDYGNTLCNKKVRTKFRSRHSKFMLSRMVVRRRDYYSCSNSTADGINDFIFVIHEMQSLWHDAHFLLTNFRGDYHGGDVQVRDHAILSLLQAKNLLEKCLPAVIDTLIETIVKKSVEGLRQLNWIIETFKYGRFMWDIKFPEEASPYVFLVLEPLQAFVDGVNTKLLNRKTIHQILIGSLKRITSCYYVAVAQIVRVVKQVKGREVDPDALERITSSINWICIQLFLDIQEYKSAIDLELKISISEVPESESLVNCLLELM